MRTGTIISGIGHVGLILWLLFGGYLTAHNDAPPIQVSDVSLITNKQFAQLTAAAAPPPARPQTKVKSPEAAKETKPAKAPKPDTPAVSPKPAPKPKQEPKPEKLPQITSAEPRVQPPKFLKAPTPEKPPAAATLSPDVHTSAPPKASQRVAPTPAPAPAPDAAVAPVPTPEAAPEKTATQAKPQKPKQAKAPKEASTQIVPEASKQAKALTGQSTAPKVSPRPELRPETPAAPAQPPKEKVAKAEKPAKPEKAKPQKAKPDTSSAVDAALAAAMSATNGAGVTEGGQGKSTHLGPPVSAADTEGLLSTLKSTWIIDPGSPSADVTVTVDFQLSPDGKVIPSTIKLVSAEGGNQTAQQIAYRKARTAILHGSDLGFNLPPAKYQEWRDIQMVFDPKGMRLQ